MRDPSRVAWHTGMRRSITAVLWSFFGIRKGRDQAQDFAQLKPLHVAIAAVGCAAVLVICLIVLVRIVLASVAS